LLAEYRNATTSGSIRNRAPYRSFFKPQGFCKVGFAADGVTSKKKRQIVCPSIAHIVFQALE
jgi:hypothetical protein